MLTRPLLALALLTSTASSVSLSLCVSACDSSNENADLPTDGGGDASTVSNAQADASVDPSGDASDDGVTQDFTVLGSGFTDLAAIVANETTVYVAERGQGTVHAMPLSGGPATALVRGVGTPSSLAIADSALFFADFERKTLTRKGLPDGELVTTTFAAKGPTALAAGSDRLVLIATSTESSSGEIQQLQFDFLAGPSIGSENGPHDIAITGTTIAWSESGSGTISTTTVGSATATVLTTTEVGCQSIAVDALGTYWTRPSEGLVRGKLGDRNVVTLAAAQRGPMSVVADPSGVYWLTLDGKLRRATRNELPLRTLAQGFNGSFVDAHLRGLALTRDYIVWITADGKVLRRAK